MNREQLIEAALRDAAREGGGWPNDDALDRWIAAKGRELSVVLALYDEVYALANVSNPAGTDISSAQKSVSVHTPTNDERAAVIAELRWLADARKNYETDTFPSIAKQVHTARLLADILERKTPVAEGGQGFGWIPSWMWDEWDQMAARRTVQGEPKRDDQPHSRACGIKRHDQGPDCNANCPTCHVFAGSGAVAAAADGMLALMGADRPNRHEEDGNG